MDKGFDTDWFADFISTKRGKSLLKLQENGTDVDTWTFDELCEIVLQFQELATAEYQVGQAPDQFPIEKVSQS